MIIATAGHVDHGKTELVRALTGVDTDRLPEEKARGLSIDLGFAYQSLPDNKTLGFVDVPGHERFIRNMLAGVSGIDLGLLVVAADDGVMPQTREHLAILNLLGIDQCVAAITKIDCVDDDRIAQVQDQVAELLDDSGHRDSNLYPLCAPDNEGVDPLRQALVQRAQATRRRTADGHFRMAIDRVFTLKGIGLVATGMVVSGSTCIDDKLLLSADGSQLRVRGIRAHNRTSEQAQAGERCAINIVGRGLSQASLKRGDWLMHPDLYAPTRRIDVDLRVLDSEPRSLKHWTATHLHIGADHLGARAAVLCGGAIAAGDRGLVQLVLERDAFAVHGDRFVLRDQSAQRTIAGGRVIDPFSPKRGRARPTRISALQAMNRHDSGEVLAALTEISESGVSRSSFSTAHNLTRAQMDALIESLALKRINTEQGQWLFSESQWQQLLSRIESVTGQFHQSSPQQSGFSLSNIQHVLKPYLDTSLLQRATTQLLSENRLGKRSAGFHLPAQALPVSERDRQLWQKASSILAPDSGSPQSLKQAAQSLEVDASILENSLRNAVKAGEMLRVGKNRYLPIAYASKLAHTAEALAASDDAGNFTVAQYCVATQTGRNFAIELLEQFDRLGFTERSGNNRRIKRPASTVFAGIDE